MRAFVLSAIGLILTVCTVQWGKAQQMLTIKPDKPVVCYYSTENRPDHVPVSDRFKQLYQRATGRTKTAVFEVEYINFPPDNLAKTAFQYALDIWESELTSSIPIRVRAEWTELSLGVLGQALWGSAYANFGGEQHMNTFYPVALAEKITRRQINGPSEADIVASFNSNTAWYFGTDGNTPAGKMDMVTIVLHEIAHGLGFTDTYNVEGTQGSVGLASGNESVPFIFDVFVQDASDKNLVHDFESPSSQLGTVLRSTNVFFDSPLSVAALGGARPELYAPATFDNGSSISHLDESTFSGPADANRLMTPQIAFAESIHDPGNVALAMLSDMGWVHTNIDHVPLKDTEVGDGVPYEVTAIITSDNGFDPDQVKLHYTTDGTNFTILNMTPTGVPDQFQSFLPGATNVMAYAYFISVVDDANRTFTNPGIIHDAGEQPQQGTHFFSIGPDFVSPEITHEPVSFIFEGDTELLLIAEVMDNLGLKEVVVEYLVNDGPVQTKVMQNAGGTDEYTAAIELPVLAIGDELGYRIVAVDMAAAENTAQLPLEGYNVVTVTGIMPVQNLYVNHFNEPSGDFFGNSFSTTTPAGFNNGAIHSDHPYKNGSGPNDESHYTYQLQIPIRISSINPVIKFEEIVLVEPGEAGSEFGDNDFFDYVVVEGSVDEGISWEIFAPGYDSRNHDVWLTRYNSTMSDDNSQSEGDSTLYRERTINMLENGKFAEGDEVLVRFRLFADQFAHGWGWAIDNLSIQEPVTDVEQPLSSELKIYPVPAQEDLFVEFFSSQNKPASIQISDLQGRIVFSEEWLTTSGVTKKNIRVQSITEGLYVLRARVENRTYIRKFLKIAH
ncbi:MAG: T9SS type A sorting domain-containing protein [Cyclobacteriaceae bacterium]